jgi:hypothetical protein
MCVEHQVGDKVSTRWGIATLEEAAPGGGFMCSWPALKDWYHMDFYLEGEPAARGAGKRNVSEISNVEM